jgi:predicted dehydrogenase
MTRVRWGVLSTASIGRLAIEATHQSDHAEFVAVASRDADRASAFAGELGLEALHRSAELAAPVDLSHGRSGRR